MAIIDATCGQCWAKPGHPCTDKKGKAIKSFHQLRKDRAKRKGVYGIRSSKLNIPSRPATAKPAPVETISQRARRIGL